ncbi:hypothetical protein AH299_25515 [Salmonella enterica]|nr:hypothetical protein [Salmonella enterica]
MFDMNALLADAAGVTQAVARSAKTLDNFPLIPQKSKNRLDVSSDVAVHKKRERDPKKMRHHVVSHLT